MTSAWLLGHVHQRVVRGAVPGIPQHLCPVDIAPGSLHEQIRLLTVYMQCAGKSETACWLHAVAWEWKCSARRL